MGTGLAGIVIILIALAAYGVWMRGHRGRASMPEPKRGMPADRPKTWDPRRRYQ